MTVLVVWLPTQILWRCYCTRSDFRIERWLRSRSCQNVPTGSREEVPHRFGDSQTKAYDRQLHGMLIKNWKCILRSETYFHLDGQRKRSTI